MEEFDSPSIDNDSWLATGGEKAREQSEKQRESYKKAQAQIQKSQKDEKKAKGDNSNLFMILERFIQNPYYEDLIPLVTTLLSKSVPSRYIISLIALFYPEATIHLLNTIGKHEDIKLLLSLHHEGERRDFDEWSLHPSIRTWMSVWVHSSQIYLTQDESSLVMQKKLLSLFTEDRYMQDALSEGLFFFFTSRNLIPDKKMMQRYAQHIISEYSTALTGSLEYGDSTIFDTDTIEDHVFFGLTEESSQASGISQNKMQ